MAGREHLLDFLLRADSEKGRNSGNDVLLFAIRSTDDKDDGRSPLRSFSAWMTLLAERNGCAMTNATEIFRK